MRRDFYGWGIHQLIAAYEKAVRDGQVMVRQTPASEGALVDRMEGMVVMGVDTGTKDYTGVHGIDFVIIDDPYAESRPVYEGEFHVVPPREAMSEYTREIAQLKQAHQAQATVKNKGPQPRTKYPRRR